MYRNWISIIVIVSALVAWVAIDSACTKNSDDTQTVRFDPLAGTTPVEAPTPAATAAAPLAKAPTPRKVVIAKLPTEFVIQVGSFSQKANADRLAKRLKEHNYKVSVTESTHKTLGKLFLVRLDPIKDLELTRTTIDKLRAQENLKPVIIAK